MEIEFLKVKPFHLVLEIFDYQITAQIEREHLNISCHV